MLKRTILASLLPILGALLIIGCTLGMGASLASASPAATYGAAEPCYEDMPCFVWSVDGNGARGVILKGDTDYTVVSACRFARLWRAHRIDWTKTDHLKGDYSALKACRR